MDPAYLDAVAAAYESGRVLLCEDRRISVVASGCVPRRVSSAWLQPTLSRAMAVGALSRRACIETVVSLALAGHHLTMFDADALALVAPRNGWSADGEFTRLAGIVSAPRVDVRSAVAVAVRLL